MLGVGDGFDSQIASAQFVLAVCQFALGLLAVVGALLGYFAGKCPRPRRWVVALVAWLAGSAAVWVAAGRAGDFIRTRAEWRLTNGPVYNPEHFDRDVRGADAGGRLALGLFAAGLAAGTAALGVGRVRRRSEGPGEKPA
jgi:hypothetical protein